MDCNQIEMNLIANIISTAWEVKKWLLSKFNELTQIEFIIAAKFISWRLKEFTARSWKARSVHKFVGATDLAVNNFYVCLLKHNLCNFSVIEVMKSIWCRFLLLGLSRRSPLLSLNVVFIFSYDLWKLTAIKLLYSHNILFHIREGSEKKW